MPLSVSEIHRAELSIVKYVQGKSFENEVKSLVKGESLPKSSTIRNLSPFLDDQGLLRVGGRLSNSSLANTEKHPYLIPHTHSVAVLIATHYHNIAHLGVEWITALVREKFWITRIRPIVKKVKHNCFTCRKLFAKPAVQRMADLPNERVQPDKAPFAHTGMDCFGPFIVRRGRSEVKRYVCLFTCFAIRAVHLEKVDSLDTDSFLNALRRFIARRGYPLTLHSDNATNFVGGKRELSKSVNDLDVQQIEKFCVMNNIEWSFNPPCASHMGGTWERMIRTVRKVLTGLLNNTLSHRMYDEMLETVLCEAESIVNSRPLTKISDDLNDLSPVTPNHLLMIKKHVALPPGVFQESDMYRKRWRAVQFIVDQFWKQWLKQYIPELQCRSKWLKKEKNFKVGDLVLISDENTPRGVWPMGIVDSVNVSKDQLVRSVTVRTKASSFVRPVTKLVSLECD
jgi:transposase InsO family protein